MEPDLAITLYAAEANLAGAGTESLTADRDEDLRAGYAGRMYTDWNRKGKKMEFEVLARIELRSETSPPFVESPKNVLIGSPVFVAQT